MQKGDDTFLKINDDKDVARIFGHGQLGNRLNLRDAGENLGQAPETAMWPSAAFAIYNLVR